MWLASNSEKSYATLGRSQSFPETDRLRRELDLLQTALILHADSSTGPEDRERRRRSRRKIEERAGLAAG